MDKEKIEELIENVAALGSIQILEAFKGDLRADKIVSLSELAREIVVREVTEELRDDA